MLPTRNPALKRGILYLVGASLCFTLMDAAAKGLVATYPAPMVLGASFAGMFVLVVLILRGRTLWHAHTRYPFAHLVRCVFQFGATGCFFASLAHIGLAEATAITDTAPVLVMLGAALFLGEKLGLDRIAGVVTAMIGMLIIVRPGSDVFSWAALLPVAAAICYTGTVLLTRVLGPRESVWTTMILSSAFGTIAGGVWAWWVWIPVSTGDLWAFGVVAVLRLLAQLGLTCAFSVAEASALAPYAYVTILFAIVWGIVFYDEWPDVWTTLGALVIVAAGLYVWRRDGSGVRAEARPEGSAFGKDGTA